MTLDRDRILALARSRVDAAEWAACAVSWDESLRLRGSELRFGATRHPMPFDGFFVFVDLEPDANWSHRARAVFVRADGGETSVVDVHFPPSTPPGTSLGVLRTPNAPD